MPHLSCEYFSRGECRSCEELALAPERRGAAKYEAFVAAARAAGLGHGLTIAPLWSPPAAFGSRGKAKLSVAGSVKAPVIGLVDRERATTELLDCPLHRPPLNEILHFLKAAVTRHGLAPYHIERRQGELKGFILKTNENGSEVLVRFVLRSRDALAKIKRVARELQKEFPVVKVASVNLQPLPAAVLEGEEEIFLTDEHVIWETYAGTRVAFMPQSFSQVTHETAEALYVHVRDLAQKTGTRSWLDLFCGVGGFSLVAASRLEWSLGIELSSQAIECARKGAEANGARGLKFETSDVEAYLTSYQGPKPDALLFNPPRRGLSAAIIERAKAVAPRQVYYSSCNPETLLRDLAAFSPDYHVETLTPFDMFPLTSHLEVVASLARS